MITFGTARHHWNYYLAIESDLAKVSRFIEFSTANLGTYSIELAHILLSASSEVDVIMKQLCMLLNPNHSTNNINDYRSVIQNHSTTLITEEVYISRYGLNVRPWDNWTGNQNPNWWRSYNNVKHERNNHFPEANLQNTINAVGALLISVTYFYKHSFSGEANIDVNFPETTRQLIPEPTFLKMTEDYYPGYLII